jgi:hypothetical protein
MRLDGGDVAFDLRRGVSVALGAAPARMKIPVCAEMVAKAKR